jgi:hypothetical protein
MTPLGVAAGGGKLDLPVRPPQSPPLGICRGSGDSSPRGGAGVIPPPERLILLGVGRRIGMARGLRTPRTLGLCLVAHLGRWELPRAPESYRSSQTPRTSKVSQESFPNRSAHHACQLSARKTGQVGSWTAKSEVELDE